MVLFFLCLIAFVHIIKCNYDVHQSGGLIYSDHYNKITDIKLNGKNNSYSLEILDVIQYPVNCIPFSTIDYNSKEKKNSIYSLKHEFQNTIYLYKNNVKIMPIEFKYSNLISGIGANNGVIIMTVNQNLYKIDIKTNKIFIVKTLSKKHSKILNSKNIAYFSIISDTVPNQFFIVFSINENYYIIQVKYIKKKNTLKLINLISTINDKPLRLVNGLALINNRLYIVENANTIYKLTLDREKNTIEVEKVFQFSTNNKIISLSAVNANYKNHKINVDYILINSKKVIKDLPSSESCLDLLVITEERTDIYNIIDLYSKDINSFYFNVYDAYLIIDEEMPPSELIKPKGIKDNLLKYNKNKKDNEFILKIIWTNDYNCTINKGFINVKKHVLKRNEQEKLPFISVTNLYSFAPSITSISYCPKKDLSLKAICYYDSTNNYVSKLNYSQEYDIMYAGNFYCDGYKNHIAFDYKSIYNLNILTYPYNNIVYVQFDKDYFLIHLPQPFSLSIDKTNSTQKNVILYVTSNDEYNNVNKCIINKLKKEYKCHKIFSKQKNNNELFQYVSYITHKSGNIQMEYIYVTDNKNSIYRAYKKNDKWVSNKWFSANNSSNRVGPISTSLSYFFVTEKALDNLIAKYPKSKILLNVKNAKKYNLYTTPDKYIFLSVSHTVIFFSNVDSYGNNNRSSIHFLGLLLNEKFHQSFILKNIVNNMENESNLNYYLNDSFVVD